MKKAIQNFGPLSTQMKIWILWETDFFGLFKKYKKSKRQNPERQNSGKLKSRQVKVSSESKFLNTKSPIAKISISQNYEWTRNSN